MFLILYIIFAKKLTMIILKMMFNKKEHLLRKITFYAILILGLITSYITSLYYSNEIAKTFLYMSVMVFIVARTFSKYLACVSLQKRMLKEPNKFFTIDFETYKKLEKYYEDVIMENGLYFSNYDFDISVMDFDKHKEDLNVFKEIIIDLTQFENMVCSQRKVVELLHLMKFKHNIQYTKTEIINNTLILS